MADQSQLLVRKYPKLSLPPVHEAKKKLRRGERERGEVPFERGAGQLRFLKGLQKGTGGAR